MPAILGNAADHRVAIGYSFPIRGVATDASSSGINSQLINNAGEKALTALGALATGTYYFFLPCAGSVAIDVITAGTSTGTGPTVTFYPVLSDGLTQKGSTATSVTFGASQTVTSLATLRGEPGVVLKVVVPAASTATFTTAEYSSL